MTRVTLPGATLGLLDENGHVPSTPPDPSHPDWLLDSAGHALWTGERTRRGYGQRYSADLSPEQIGELAAYLDGVADLLRSMTREERGDSGAREIRACEAGLRALGYRSTD